MFFSGPVCHFLEATFELGKESIFHGVVAVIDKNFLFYVPHFVYGFPFFSGCSRAEVDEFFGVHFPFFEYKFKFNPVFVPIFIPNGIPKTDISYVNYLCPFICAPSVIYGSLPLVKLLSVNFVKIQYVTQVFRLKNVFGLKEFFVLLTQQVP